MRPVVAAAFGEKVAVESHTKEVAMRRMLLSGLVVLVGVAWIGRAPLPQTARAEAADPAPAPKKPEYELRIIRVGNTFQGVRFKVGTGESWYIDREKYVAIAETGPVAAGDFDVTLVTDDTNWMAFRIDRVSGATWQMRNNKWNKVKEADDKGP
jgi:hypothetical protein